LLVYFSLTLFLSALLLFLVQPMVAKMILPSLGGTPAVWNTCMVFFQATLLLGYLYSHVTTKWLGVRQQAAMHLVVLLLPFLVLPLNLSAWGAPPGEANPIPWMLLMLASAVGLPFVVVSATAPLLQKWFANTGHPAASDPYFLYAASNLGSMVALLGYPFLVEPLLTLADQTSVWMGGYAVLALLMVGCAALLWRNAAATPLGPSTSSDETVTPAQDSALGTRDSTLGTLQAGVTPRRCLRWITLSFVPSSLLLGFTTYLTTDIAAIPLLWVVPLAVYLLTFILVFARKPPLPHWLMIRLLPLVVLPSLILLITGAFEPLWLVMPVHFLAFFLASMVCHGELAKDRPAAEHLTTFYLLMSVGGVLGGLFNALVAPLAFDSVAEYPLALVLACLLLPRREEDREEPTWVWTDLAAAAALGMLGAGLLFAVRQLWQPGESSGSEVSLPLKLLLGLMALFCFPLVRRPVRFGLCVGAVTLVGLNSPVQVERVVHQERSFFGVHRVMLDPEQRFHLLVHGNTNHGVQCLDPAQRGEPLAYYHRTGPLGQVFDELQKRPKPPHLAVIGLGSGSIACYLAPAQRLTYYEIDPSVLRIASDPDFFSFLGDSQGRIDTVLGDGRITLSTAADGQYGLLVVDAFSSDAIPLHLITREALALYQSKLALEGILVFHISNRYLNLEPVLGDLAADAGLVCRAQLEYQSQISSEELKNRKSPSHYVIMAREVKALGTLAGDPRWHAVDPRPNERVWTDDYSNIIRVWK
jgi:hypothetical protein